MAVLQSTNVQGTLCVNGVAVGGGKDFYFCCVSGSTTYTPSSGLVSGDGILDITLVGGGGGGAMCSCTQSTRGGGGGGGAIYQGLRKMTDSTTACTLTVGAGGAGSAVSGVGNDGGDTIFDSCLTPGAIAFGGGGGGNCRGTAGGHAFNGYRQNCLWTSAGSGGGATTPSRVQNNNGTWGGTQVFTGRPVPYNHSSSLNENPVGAVGFGSQIQSGGDNRCYPTEAGRGIGNMGNGGGSFKCALVGGGAGRGEGENAGGFGNGGAGACTGTSGAGSDGIIILKWAE